ncbi:DUF6443 domain-containing protein [Pinibacter aurantiacus]|uniref:DUF6443 domain-containing protein n=1 Tax=Pinibacter aurantiacus TaxID=2851599 RepID=A0A9E2S9M7_9BACT|nr:DUF6443 domain-containing protein [Pinibacter aurantiacus]MBV4359033.1 hypothetical protein [Pinibacter aurantiacus]
MKHAFKIYSWLVLIFLLGSIAKVNAQLFNPDHTIGTVSGVYSFSYNQVPDDLVEVIPAVTTNLLGLTVYYQWESCDAPTGTFTPISGASGSSYHFTSALTKNMWYRRQTRFGAVSSMYSNVIKLTLVSQNWEDVNYIREHVVTISGQTDWKQVDQLPIGNKFQTTTYLDGLGRPVQQVGREVATPAQGSNTWGDVVKFSQYDAMGREAKKYLSYTTTSEIGKYKTATATEHPQYYTNVFNETSAFSSLTFDNSPLNRLVNAKQPGSSWAAGAGTSITYEVNSPTDVVRILSADFVKGDAPLVVGIYNPGTLLKVTYTDENGKKIVEFTDNAGRSILKKVQLDDAPGATYSGWICTYSVYDDFGRLRFTLQPEAVKYLDANSWSFAGTNGTNVLNEWCFQYFYDERGRMTWKKTPGADPLYIMYDNRNRQVFTQDGNQRLNNQWMVTLYDDLDRPLATALYNTTKTPNALQTDINNAPTTFAINVTMGAASVSSKVTSLNPISTANLNDPLTITMLKFSYYDDYSFNTAKGFNTGFTNTSAYGADVNVLPIVQDMRTLNMTTGTTTRVLGTTIFLNATDYYDKDGSPLQSQEDNIKGGNDITTRQYHWDGRVLSTCNTHTAPGTAYSNFITLSKYNFDKIGRVTSLQKKYGSNDFKTVVSYDYDDLGRLKTKHLDPGYNNLTTGNAELEALNYSYNIHGQITGINKDFALKTVTYNKWSHYFGMYLGFDNKDGVFANNQLNGQVTGQLWNTMGDDVQRRYDYLYDNAGRLTSATFNEQAHPGDGWSNAKMDFSVNGTGGKITYDLNGNLLTMLQKGVVPGQNTPLIVDDLHYSYAAIGNKLQSVTDNMISPSQNGMSGDFKDGANSSTTPDYVYDANGNLIVDLNKNVQNLNNGGANTPGISYNFLDKPELIKIGGKGTIQIVYDADGRKLKRTFTPESGDAVTTTYIDAFVYKATGTGSDVLDCINFEEGRIRPITPVNTGDASNGLLISGNMTLPDSKQGAYDYFVLDYQQNVRMILTEETQSAANTCTMETATATSEESLFGQLGPANEVSTTRVAKPIGWNNSSDGSSVSELGNIAGHNIGPNVLQKVMAGDRISASAQYWFQSGAPGNNSNIVTNVLSSLIASLASGPVSSAVKAGATSISSQLGSLPAFANDVQPSTSNPSAPQAYLTILFFDERFNLIPAADGGVQQAQVSSSVSDQGSSLGPLPVTAPKNGYVYVYLSNRSDQSVYFDNFKVQTSAGNIVEENHYYAFGLKIAALSSHKLPNSNEGTIKNNYLYQGAYSELDEDIQWQDFALRNYDAQIGRFVQQDPFDQFPSPYTGMGNDPIALTDPSGGVSLPGSGIVSDVFQGSKTIEQAEVIVIAIKAVKPVTVTGDITSKVASLAMASINIAATVVRAQLASDALNNKLSSPAVQSQLKLAIDFYAYQHALPDLDKAVVTTMAANYLKGLNLMAWWCRDDFDKLDRTVISGGGQISDIKRIAIVEAGIKDEQSGVAGIFREGANTAIFVATQGLFPKVGAGPRIPFRSNTQQQIVDVGIARAGTQSTVQANRTAGNLFRDELADALRAEGRVVRTEVYKWTPFGRRYMDLDVWYNGVNLGGIETKVGGSRYFTLQRLKDGWLRSQGYEVNLVRKPANW